jgi:uncharacterized protein
MPCQTSFACRRYCIHQEEKAIDPVNSTSAAGYLLSGASGMLGSALKSALAARHSTVLQLVRSAPTQPNQLQWDPNAAVPHPEDLEGRMAAIHLSGANLGARRWTPGYKAELVRSRVNSTRALATTLASLRYPPQTLLVASATGIYGNRGDELLDETSTLGTGFLAETCRQWEAAAQPAVDAGIRVIHLRFGVILSADSGSALARFLPAFRFGLGAQLGNGRQYMSWISLPDAVAAILFLLETPTIAGPVNLTAPNPVTNSDFTLSLANQLHRPALLTIPNLALRAVFGEMASEVLLASARAYPARLASNGFRFTHSNLIYALPAVLGPQPS